MDSLPPTEIRASTDDKKLYQMEFKGESLEFVKLVLVNVLLSIVTLGIYSAWAKVRTRKYIYGHTYLNESNFDYHAEPIQILKGRLIIGALFLLYTFGGKLTFIAPFIAVGLFIGFLPWIFVRSMAFNLGNTSYRQIRFGFNRKYQEAYKTFYFGYLIAIVTLGLGFPYFYYKVADFRVSNTRFGKTSFTSLLQPSYFYSFMLISLGLYLGAIFGSVFFSIFLTTLTGAKVVSIIIMTLFIYGGLLAAGCFFQSRLFNTIHANARLDGIRMIPSMSALELMKIYLKGLGVTIITLGLGAPYIWFLLIQYKAKSLQVEASEADFARFDAAAKDAGGAIEDSIGDFWDIDIGL